MSETRKRAPLGTLTLLGLLTLLTFFALPTLPASAASSIVQENNAGCGLSAPATTLCTGSATLQVAFTNPVTSGDVVVVALAIDGAPVSSVTDSLGSTFSQAVTESVTGGSFSGTGVLIYYATLASGGSDTVTVTLGFPPGETADVFIYEVSGVTVTGAATASGSGTSATVASSTISYQGGGYVMAVVQTSSTTSATAGSGFTLVNPASGTGQGFTEYLSPGGSSSTTFPLTVGGSAGDWAEAGIVLSPSAPAQVAVGLTLDADSQSTAVNSTNYFTVSYSSGGSPATAKYTGTPLSFQADANTNVQVSATSSSSGTGVGWCLAFTAGSCQAVTFGTGSSGATESYYYYQLFAEPVSYSLLGGGSYAPGQPPEPPHLSYVTAPTAAGSSDAPLTLGSPGISGQVLPSTPPFTAYVLRGTTASVEQYLGGAPAGERWVLSSSSAMATTINMVPVGQWTVTKADEIDNPIQYQDQFEVSFAASPSSGGTTNPSGADLWYDSGATVSISATANAGSQFSSWSSSDPAITFAGASSASTTATIGGSGTITATFTSTASTVYANLQENIGIADSYAPASATSLTDSVSVSDQYNGQASVTAGLNDAVQVTDAYTSPTTATLADGLQVSDSYTPPVTASLSDPFVILDLKPTLAASPDAGAPGAVITLSGTGYAPGTAYSFCVRSSDTPCPGGSSAFTSTLATPGAIPGGTTITFPDLGPGTYFVVVSSGNAVLVTAPFTVSPQISSLSPASGPAGTHTVVTGTGFQPGNAYDYCFSQKASTCFSAGTLTAGADGSISFTATVPAGTTPAGPYLLIIETPNAPTRLVAYRQFMVTAQVATDVQTSGGGASVNDGSTTGTSVAITGSTAADGTSATITSTVLGSQPAGTSGSILTSAGYYDVKVTGITDGNARICITNPGLTPFSTMQYWTGSQWADAASLSFSGSDTLCGTVPVADLQGTPVFLGTQSYAVTFSESGIGSDAAGSALTVDGAQYSAVQLPLTFTWTEGSQHSYTWSAAVSSAISGEQYAWSSASGLVSSEAGLLTVPSGGGSVSGAFTTQYYLGIAVSGAGSVSTSAGWQDADSSVTLSAAGSSGYSFSSWTGSGVGSYTGTSNPFTLYMSGPVNETASFASTYVPPSTYSVTFTESGLPVGASWEVTFNGATRSSTGSSITFGGVLAGSFSWNSSSIVQGTEPGVRYAPSASDAGALTVSANAAQSVSFATQYLVSFAATPPGGGSTSPAQGTDWYGGGSSVAISATPASGYAFVSWSSPAGITIASPDSSSTTATVSAPGTLTAEFEPTVPACTSASGETCGVSIIGGTASANETSTGIYVEITGSTAPAGTLVNITTTAGSTSSPSGVGTVALSDARYFDVKVTGANDGTARICITAGGPPSNAEMDYWNGASWVGASDVTVSSASVCGQVPVPALSGTPVAIGYPPATVTTTTSSTTASIITSQTSVTNSRSTGVTSATQQTASTASSVAGPPSRPGASYDWVLESLAVVIVITVAGALALSRRRR